MRRATTRRRVLQALSGGTAVLLAGCSGGNGGDGGGDGGTDLSVDTPQGDASITLKLNVNVGNDDLSSVVVDLEKVIFERKSGDPVGLAIGETGLDLTEFTGQEGYTITEDHPFPATKLTAAKLHMPVQEATLKDGSSVEFEGSDPLKFDLILMDDPLSVSAGSSANLTLSVTPRSGFSEDDPWSFSTGWAMFGG